MLSLSEPFFGLLSLSEQLFFGLSRSPDPSSPASSPGPSAMFPSTSAAGTLLDLGAGGRSSNMGGGASLHASPSHAAKHGILASDVSTLVEISAQPEEWGSE